MTEVARPVPTNMKVGCHCSMYLAYGYDTLQSIVSFRESSQAVRDFRESCIPVPVSHRAVEGARQLCRWNISRTSLVHEVARFALH